jgi:hypothetical protein
MHGGKGGLRAAAETLAFAKNAIDDERQLCG